MFPVSARFLAALGGSHTVIARVDAYSSGRCVAYDIPFSDGSVSVSSGTGIHRKLDLTISDPSLWDLLTPVGVELRAFRGVRHPGGFDELVPLGVFGLDQQSTPILRTGAITVSSAPDRWAYVQRRRFELPRTSEPSLTAVQSIVALATEAVSSKVETGGVSFAGNHNADVPTTTQVWDRDRDSAIEDLATAAGVEVFYGPQGELVVRNVSTMTTHAVWKVHAGQRGVLLGAEATRDRTRVYNVIVVVSGKTDGSAPFQPQVVEDRDPTSITNVTGPYGRAPYFLITNTITDATAARAAGAALLTRTRGRFIDMSVDAIVNPALETGDTISTTTVKGNTHLYMVDSFTVPLTAEGSQSLTLRTLAAVTDDASTTDTTTGS